MKKLLFSAALLFAAVAGYNCYNNGSASDDEMTDLMKANLEALAERIPDCTSVCHQYNGWMCTRTYKGVTSTCVNFRKDV
ncbi:MAG: NVEALA domain-containing protein [Bacteroidaceae bacterium]|nr:NVEALA domain-containing protein [Bacteroidaceae bacterium]